jgi:hypothetical protein
LSLDQIQIYIRPLGFGAFGFAQRVRTRRGADVPGGCSSTGNTCRTAAALAQSSPRGKEGQEESDEREGRNERRWQTLNTDADRSGVQGGFASTVVSDRTSERRRGLCSLSPLSFSRHHWPTKCTIARTTYEYHLSSQSRHAPQ